MVAGPDEEKDVVTSVVKSTKLLLEKDALRRKINNGIAGIASKEEKERLEAIEKELNEL